MFIDGFFSAFHFLIQESLTWKFVVIMSYMENKNIIYFSWRVKHVDMSKHAVIINLLQLLSNNLILNYQD